MMNLGKVFLISLFLIGCSNQPRIVYVTTPLELPLRPELPKINSENLACVSDSTKKQLLNRDIIFKNYISELETIIKSTRK